MIGEDAFGLAFEGEDEAVAEGGDGGGLNVFLGNMEAAIEQSTSAAGSEHRLRGTGRGSVTDETFHVLRCVVAFGVGSTHDLDEVILHAFLNWDLTQGLAEGEDVFSRGDGLDLRHGIAAGAIKDLAEVVVARQGDVEFEAKAVELSLGQRVGAVVFDWVLGGEHEKREVERMRLARHGDMLFLHGFEQGGLGFGSGSVDLVGEEDVTKNRSALELEGAFSAVLRQDLRAYHVGGQEIGGELDARKVEVERLGEGVDQSGFPKSGNALK